MADSSAPIDYNASFRALPGSYLLLALESQRDLAASHEQVRQTLRPDTMPLLRYNLERPPR